MRKIVGRDKGTLYAMKVLRKATLKGNRLKLEAFETLKTNDTGVCGVGIQRKIYFIFIIFITNTIVANFLANSVFQ